MKTKELAGLANEYKERESSGRAHRQIVQRRPPAHMPLSAMYGDRCYELMQTGLPGDCQMEYCGRSLPCVLHPVRG